MANTLDVFGDLLAAKWRDIEFPVTRTRVAIAHELVEHKYWGRDGARVESTGLAPYRFSFSVPFINGLTPGRSEKWKALYPTAMRELLAAFQQKEQGMLQHPEFGIIVCKAERFDLDWDATRRGGADAELTFIQTLTAEDLEVMEDSPVKEPFVGDLNKESVKADLKALLEAAGVDLPPYLQDESIDLDGLANKVKAITDFPTLLSYRAAGRINNIVYHAERIQDSALKSKNALTWPVVFDAERAKAAAHNLQQKLLEGPKQIALYTVPFPTTLAGVATSIPGAKVSDLIRLNPGLMRSPEIDKGTVVRYYITSAA